MLAMPKLPWQRPGVIVVGSLHIDTVAERDETDTVDVPGSLVQSIGGGAYNIAVNLGRHRRVTDGPIFLWAFVPKKTPLTPIIKSKLRMLGVSRRHVVFTDTYDNRSLTLGGFVGMRSERTKDMMKAATQTTIETLTPLTKDREVERFCSALRKCHCVALDTNINGPTMKRILGLCAANTKAVFVAIVAEGKAKRHCELYKTEPPPSQPAYLVSGRPKEIRSILETDTQAPVAAIHALMAAVQEGKDIPPSISPEQVCAWVKAKHVLINPHRGRDYCYLLSSGGSWFKFHPVTEDAPPEGNFTGLGDSIFAGLVQVYCRLPKESPNINQVFNLNDPAMREQITKTVSDFACDIIRVKGATPSSVISFTESDLPVRSRWFRWVNRTVAFVREWWTIIYTAIVVILAWFGINFLSK